MYLFNCVLWEKGTKLQTKLNREDVVQLKGLVFNIYYIFII